MNFYIYLLYSESSDKYYAGYSNNPLKRFAEHNNSEHSTYTAKHRPWQLKAVFLVGTNEAEAIKIERFIKQQKSRTLLERLINPEFQPTGFLARLVRVPYTE
jgi:putative endonuclease